MQNFKLIGSLHTGHFVDKPLSSQVPRVKPFSRTPAALKSRAIPGSLWGIFPHHTHPLYLFWALLQFVRSLSCDCVKPAPSHKAVSQALASRTTARRQWLSHCHWVSRLEDYRMNQWPLSPATACRTSAWSMWKQPKQCPLDTKFL